MDYYGLKVRLARTRNNFSQKTLGYNCNMKQQYISEIERNKRKVSEEVLERMAKGMGMTLDEIKNSILVQHNQDQQGGNAANLILQNADENGSLEAYKLLVETLKQQLEAEKEQTRLWQQQAQQLLAQLKGG